MRAAILIIIIQVISFVSFANKPDTIPETGNAEQARINEVRWMISDMIDGSLNIGYERKVGQNISLALNLGFKGEDGLINLSGIETKTIETSSITYSGYKIIPEFRYYIKNTQQNELDGFYFGAYSKYTRFRSNLYGTYINDEGTEYRIDARADIDILGLGLMVGYKLPVSKRFSVDFLIAAPGGSDHKYKLKNVTTLPDEFYDDLVEALEKYSLYDFLNTDFKWEPKKRSTRFFFPSFRYGVSISYRF